MSNAAKYKKKAAELELQKQFDKAVAMYMRAIEAGDAEGAEVDVTVLNKVGDLALRLGRIDDAVTSYERAVDHYATVGLFNNAIALCHKILRHAPDRAGIYLTLGRVCAHKGMRGDATRNFLEYAARLRQEGRTDEAMRSLAEIARRMPELEEVRRLVEEHAERVGIALPAAAAPDEGRPDVAARRDLLVFLDIDYDAPVAHTPPLGVLPITGRARPLAAPALPVAASLTRSLTRSLDDLLIFDPLSEDARPEEPTGGLDVAVDEAREPEMLPGLVRDDDPEARTPRLQPERRPASNDDVSPAVHALDRSPEDGDDRSPEDGDDRSPEDGDGITLWSSEVRSAVELEVLSPDDGVAAVTPPSEESVALRELDGEEAGVLALIDHAVVNTLIAPETARTPIGAALVVADPPVSSPLPPTHSARSARVMPRLDPHDFLLPGELPPIVVPDHWLELHALPPIVGPDYGLHALPPRPSSASADVDAAPVASDAPAPTPHAAAAGVVIDRDAVDAAFGTGVDFAAGVTALDTVNALDAADAALTPPDTIAVFNRARDRCAPLRDAVHAHPGDWARRRRLAEALLEAGERASGLEELAAAALGLEVEGALPDAARVLDELVRVAPEQVGYHQKRVELAVRLGDRDRLRESYLDLADALVQLGQAVRAESVYVRVLELEPWDGRARAALGHAAPPPPSPEPSSAPADDGYVTLADWLADDAAPRDSRACVTAPPVTAPPVSGNDDGAFVQLRPSFRAGVARRLGEDDYASHYDLGVAYKAMGLLDDAVAEFQQALRSPIHRLPAYEALGHCFLEQGSFPVAVTVLSRALQEPGLDDEQRVGVLYLLGYACEALQRRDEARSYYQRVYATDMNFRDVAERLTVLAGSAR